MRKKCILLVTDSLLSAAFLGHWTRAEMLHTYECEWKKLCKGIQENGLQLNPQRSSGRQSCEYWTGQ